MVLEILTCKVQRYHWFEQSQMKHDQWLKETTSTWSVKQKISTPTSSLSSLSPWWGVRAGVRPRVALSVTSILGAVLSNWVLRVEWRGLRWWVTHHSDDELLIMSNCYEPGTHHAGHCSLHLGGSLVKRERPANLWMAHWNKLPVEKLLASFGPGVSNREILYCSQK